MFSSCAKTGCGFCSTFHDSSKQKHTHTHHHTHIIFVLKKRHSVNTFKIWNDHYFLACILKLRLRFLPHAFALAVSLSLSLTLSHSCLANEMQRVGRLCIAAQHFPTCYSDCRISMRTLLPFIAEITKYIIKLRVHKRTTTTSAKPCTAVSAAAGQHSSASQPPSMTTPESMWLWHQCSCLTAPHPPAFDWHSMQPVGALRAQAGKLAAFLPTAVGALQSGFARHSTLDILCGLSFLCKDVVTRPVHAQLCDFFFLTLKKKKHKTVECQGWE